MHSITLPLKLPSVANQRLHHMAKARQTKTQRQAGFISTPKGLPLPAIVTITRISAGTLDTDNLASACKGLRDGIAQKLGIDDGSPLVEWRYAQIRGGRGVFKVQIQIEARA